MSDLEGDGGGTSVHQDGSRPARGRNDTKDMDGSSLLQKEPAKLRMGTACIHGRHLFGTNFSSVVSGLAVELVQCLVLVAATRCAPTGHAIEHDVR